MVNCFGAEVRHDAVPGVHTACIVQTYVNASRIYRLVHNTDFKYNTNT